MEERKGWFHTWEEELGETSKRQLIQKWTTFSWRLPTERQIGRMLRNGERGAGGYDEGLMNALREVERNMDGGSRCSLDLLVVCISIRMLTLWVSFVLWCLDPGISHACSCTSFHICFSDADRIFYYGQPTKSPYLLLFYQKKTLFIVFMHGQEHNAFYLKHSTVNSIVFFFLFSMLMLAKCKKCSFYFFVIMLNTKQTLKTAQL